MRRLGVLGGTFDPVHEGHVALAREAMRQESLDGVILLPMGRPVHREADTQPSDRLAMCRLAVAEEPGMMVSQAGIQSGVRSTADTLGPLRREFPDAAFTMIVGADKLLSMPYWQNADKVFSQCGFLCFPRAGVNISDAMAKVQEAGAKVKLLQGASTPHSASLIRARISAYEDAPGLSKPVLCYIAENGLYQKDYTPQLRQMMNPRRFQHTLGVRKEAVRLAALHGIPVLRSALAGILHDCAKGMSVQEMARIATENRLVDDENMLSSNAMLHGPVGAWLAQKQFGVKDEEVLWAIRSHTIGRPGMSPMELCIFVADATEENREDYEGLADLRYLAEGSLAAAALYSMRLTQEYLKRTNRPFFPIVFETMRYLESTLTPTEWKLLRAIE